MYVQYGCGMSPANEWRNFDASPTLRFERIPIIGKLYTKNANRFPENVEYGDIVKGLPVPDESCKGIYCSHVLEHLSLEDIRTALRSTYRILMPGGTFRLVMPDLAEMVTAYQNSTKHDAAIKFIRDTGMGHEKRICGIRGFSKLWLGNSSHLWLWDYDSISRELDDIGFTGIRRAQFGDSLDSMFSKAEKADRWCGCLGVECKK